MQEVLYIEVPTPATESVKYWLQQDFKPLIGDKSFTSSGIRLGLITTTGQEVTISDRPESDRASATKAIGAELAIFVWTVQRTTYLKVFRWSAQPFPQEERLLRQLTQDIRQQFPNHYPAPPEIDLAQQSIFDALEQEYPLTVRYFKRMPNGEYDLKRAYWWERRWRERVRQPQESHPVLITQARSLQTQEQANPTYDLIYVGGALGVIHAAAMAQLGYRVLLIERLPFGRMNREWNISRSEFQSLIDLGLFTPAEFETVIAREYVDGFHKFFDANNPPQAKAPILHTPTVLNVGLDAEKLLRVCGDKLRAAEGEIWDETEFMQAEVGATQVTIQTRDLTTQELRQATGRLLVDAMGTASPIAWQLNGGRAFDSVCPTVGAVISSGFEPGVWDVHYGDVLNSHGDISRGRQLIWELFPAEGEELTFYLFHYHQVHPDNPGSLLEMYEDFFTILPEYRRCDIEQLVWKKPTFGYIPGHFTINSRDRQIGVDRVMSIGDAASLQSPLIFTGFGSLVRNLPRLTQLLDTALKHDLLQAEYLNQIRAYQSNVSVTWLFSKGMMVPTGRNLPPERVNSMLNTFFGILAAQSPAIAEAFIKDRVDWLSFNRMALQAAWQNPRLLVWIWEMAGPRDLLRWLSSYVSFTLTAFIAALIGSWFPNLLVRLQPWLESRLPRLWFWLLSRSYIYTDGVGKPQAKNRFQPFSPAVTTTTTKTASS